MAMTGKVKFYDRNRGFGFIIVDGEDRDIFVHIRSCPEAVGTLIEGQRVRFDEGISSRTGRPEAENVTLLHAAIDRLSEKVIG